MEDHGGGAQNLPAPPPRLFERLAQLSGYTWDQSTQPFHSSYDNWHVFGIHHSQDSLLISTSIDSGQGSPLLVPGSKAASSYRDASTNDTASEASGLRYGSDRTYTPVVARISTHVLRLEREYHLSKSLVQTSDPTCAHTVRPIELIKLPSHQGDSGPIVVSTFESPGRNYLRELVDFDPTLLDQKDPNNQQQDDDLSEERNSREKISLSVFLDFAIGACESLELLHHGLKVVHGDLRADAFHFNQETGVVKLINFGSGPRSFENGLTSAGWLTLSREVGIKKKLQFVAPEQTGRMPAEPDSRTDIYSLGVLFWTMLTQEPAFDGETPIDIVQSVLSRRIPPVASKTMDIPDVISSIIEKMTRKQIDQRYHSSSGLKYDLTEVQRILMNGDGEALQRFQIGTRDVSSFFVLPTAIFGRDEQHKRIVRIIEKVSRRQAPTTLPKLGMHNLSSTSSTSDGHPRSPEEKISDSSSQPAETEKEPHFLGAASNVQLDSQDSMDSIDTAFGVNSSSPKGYEHKEALIPTVANPPAPRFHEYNNSLNEAFSNGDEKSTSNLNGAEEGPRESVTGGGHRDNLVVPIQRGTRKFHRKGRCEVIEVVGAAGVGKSSLVQSVQGEIRRLGYFASGKFDNAQKAPFEPVLGVLSSLFRQIFSESDVNTEYHHGLRHNFRGMWPSLCKMLDLPNNLIHESGDPQHLKSHSGLSQLGPKRSSKAETIESSTQSTHSGGSGGGPLAPRPSRGAATAQSMRFMNTFLDVLRILTSGKLICMCLDDLHFADNESIDLITNIILGKLRIVLMITCRRDEVLPSKIKAALDSGQANVTKLELSNLSEEEVVSYISATLYRPIEYVFPLAAVCLEKTLGNPFYLRQMLEVCHQKNCLWYSWKDSLWHFDLDRIFAEFESEIYGQQLNTGFITRRLQEQLPPLARSILAWASLLGNTFSFACIQRLLSGEFSYSDDLVEDAPTCPTKAALFTPDSPDNAVRGLQACLQAYILMPGEMDDEFRFSHDRYVQASASLRECHDVEKMHFIIAQTVVKYFNLDERSLYARARHICQAARLIKLRITHRSRFRGLLLEASKQAIESGARASGLYYLENCINLMQPDPWTDDLPDVYYDETLDVYTKAAELYWYQGQLPEARRLIDSTFAYARSSADKASSWILLSRMHAQKGDLLAAFNTLKTSLAELGLEFDRETTWEACDKEYKRLHKELEAMETEELVQMPPSEDVNVFAIGSIMMEAMSAAYWSDALLFYQMIIKMTEVHLRRGAFTQAGLAFTEFGVVEMSRFGNSSLRMYTTGLRLLRRFNDPYTLGRGLTISLLFIAHLNTPIRDHINVFEEAIDHTLAAGDKILFLIAIGGLAISKLYLGQDMADLESFCTYAPEDFGGWTHDLRGGLIITAVKQVARSLQGKTFISAGAVMSDEDHDSEKYIQSVRDRASSFVRPRDIYCSVQMIPLYMFGFYDEAIDLGNELLLTIDDLWSIRNAPLILFYLSLSLLARHRNKGSLPDSNQSILAKVTGYNAKINLWQVESPVNYLMWCLLVDAEASEIAGNYDKAIQAYEAAIDHTQLHGFALEEALAYELQGAFYARRGSKRATRAIIEDAIAAYARIRATGKVEQLTAKYQWILQITTRPRKDMAVQTAKSLGDNENTQYRIEENERQEVRHLGKETAGDRTEAWLKPSDGSKLHSKGPEIGGLDLDILDLQSILEFNHAISSELQIDSLLAKMTRIILECSGAEYAGVVVESEGGEMSMAASGTMDAIVADTVPLTDVKSETVKQVIFYTLRFKETVFVQNILQDERFSPNATSAKAVMSLPIVRGGDQFQLLGVLYLEGQANSFTARNLGVLRLFCNQVGISIANALLFRRIRKVSASNTSMIESQKRALANAIEAENKAKVAEAEAIRNVRLKEEAAKAKSMFLANVSHELRTPLNGVIGMSELIKGTSLNREQEGYADSIRVCADTLLTVINDILDFSKLEAGKMKLFSVPLNLRETITEVVRALSFTNLERGLRTIEDLGDLDPNLLVMSDPVRIHQIFMNLLSNAYKFTPVSGTITVKARKQKEDDRSIQVTCSVTDTGIGITQEQLSRLFKPFSQADDSTQRAYGGSGLGLSICKALVGVLKGKIWLESQIGVGTVVSFTITFPKAIKGAISSHASFIQDSDSRATWSSDTEVQGAPSSSIINLSKIPRDEIRICIAEDNPINQKIAVSFVKKLGFKSIAYNDGMAALEGLRSKSRENVPFHLVLMDCQMPVCDGYDATRLIRQDEDPAVRGVLIIAMTASAIRGDREKCLEAGMNNYLAKPVRAAVLKSMLEEYLSQPTKPISNIQETANNLAKGVIQDVKAKKDESQERPVRKTSPLKVSLSQANGKLSPGMLRDSPASVALPPRRESLSSASLPMRSKRGSETAGERTPIPAGFPVEDVEHSDTTVPSSNGVFTQSNSHHH